VAYNFTNKESALSVIISDELFIQQLSPVSSSDENLWRQQIYKLHPLGNIYNTIADKIELELLLQGSTKALPIV